jgi:hypothetical protein
VDEADSIRETLQRMTEFLIIIPCKLQGSSPAVQIKSKYTFRVFATDRFREKMITKKFLCMIFSLGCTSCTYVRLSTLSTANLTITDDF